MRSRPAHRLARGPVAGRDHPRHRLLAGDDRTRSNVRHRPGQFRGTGPQGLAPDQPGRRDPQQRHAAVGAGSSRPAAHAGRGAQPGRLAGLPGSGQFRRAQPRAAGQTCRRPAVRRVHRGPGAPDGVRRRYLCRRPAPARLPGQRLGDHLPARPDRPRTRCSAGSPAPAHGPCSRPCRRSFGRCSWRSTRPRWTRPIRHVRTAPCCRSAGSSWSPTVRRRRDRTDRPATKSWLAAAILPS